MDNNWPRVLLLARSSNQLSITIKILTKLNPVINLPNVQTIGFTKTAWIKILNDAIDAKAAKTLICPTYPTRLGIVFAPAKYPIKYPDIIAPVAKKLNSSITDLTPSKFPWKPCAIISTKYPVKRAHEFFNNFPIERE